MFPCLFSTATEEAVPETASCGCGHIVTEGVGPCDCGMRTYEDGEWDCGYRRPHGRHLRVRHLHRCLLRRFTSCTWNGTSRTCDGDCACTDSGGKCPCTHTVTCECDIECAHDETAQNNGMCPEGCRTWNGSEWDCGYDDTDNVCGCAD